jgi:hypothetical protein
MSPGAAEQPKFNHWGRALKPFDSLAGLDIEYAG